MCVCGACFGTEVFRKPEKQDVAEKIENRFFDCRVSALGCGDCTLDYLPVFVAHRPAGGKISPINGKTGDRLADSARKRLECEVAIPSVLLGKPIDHVA